MPDRTDQFWDTIAAEVAARNPLVLATIVRDSGSVPRRTGARMLVHPDRRTRGTVGGGIFEMLVVRDAISALAAGRSGTRSYSFNPKGVEPDAFGAVCGGRADVFLEVIMPPDRLLIVGGGHVGRAVARAAALLDFEIVLADDRAEYAGGANAPDAGEIPPQVKQVIHVSPDYRELPAPDANTYVVLVSKGFITDEAALRRVIDAPVPYLGMIGSTNKRETVFNNLRRDGIAEEKLSRIHAPIGLEIGAETPAEIAVSILAEVIKIRAARRAGAGTADASESARAVP